MTDRPGFAILDPRVRLLGSSHGANGQNSGTLYPISPLLLELHYNES